MNTIRRWMQVLLVFMMIVSLLSPTAVRAEVSSDEESSLPEQTGAIEDEQIGTTDESELGNGEEDKTLEEASEPKEESLNDELVENIQLDEEDDLGTQLQEKSEMLWNKASSSSSLIYERIMALWQTGYVDRDLLKGKSNASVSYETLTNYTNAVMQLAVTHSNPYSYENNNYVEKLASSQVGEGYFSFGSDTDKKAENFVNALFALEFVDADYNRDTALTFLESMKEDIKKQTNGVPIGLAVSALSKYEGEKAQALREELLLHYKNSGAYFTQGLGLYVDNLYALGENPLDEKWYLKITDEKYISVKEAYSILIHPNDSFSFHNRLKSGEAFGQSNESVTATHWSLIGLTSLVNNKSMIEDAREQFAAIEFDFTPKTIEVSNVTQPYLVKGTTFKPSFIVRDMYSTQRTATLNMQSSNPSILDINEKNELMAKEAGQAAITVTVEGYENIKAVLVFTVTADEKLVEILPKIEKAIGHVTSSQDKLSSFEDAVALKTFGYDQEKIAKRINLYGSLTSSPYNEARNILSLVAAGLDPYTYNGKNYVEMLHNQLETTANISAEHAAQIIMAQYVLGESPSEKVTTSLLSKLVEKDGASYIETLGSPDVRRTAKALQAVTLINNEQLVTEDAEKFLVAEGKLFTFFKNNVQNGQFKTQPEEHAVAVLNYLSLKQLTSLEGFDVHTLAGIILANQYNNSYITNGMIPNLSALQSESTGIGLNALSYLLTSTNAYTHLKQKDISKPTTIALQLPDKAKVNVPFELKGMLLDQNAKVIESDITWTVNNEQASTTYTPKETGSLTIRAEAQGIVAEKEIEVIDYQKVFSIKINPIENVVTDQNIELTATVKDSEDEVVTDAIITWGIEGQEPALMNGSIVRFLKPGKYVITAESEGVKAKAIEVVVELNTESIQTQVIKAVESMKQYLEKKGQYDYISALAYSQVINNAEASQYQMRTIGHLREYGNHDEKYSLYYAKNILQAAAASEDPKHYATYKGPVVDLVKPLVEAQDKDGHFTMFTNFDKPSVATQAWSIIALDLIDEPYDVELAIKDLLNGLNGPISEGSYKEQELRALALIALSKHRNIEGVDQQITTILNYLKSQQNDTGGFNYGGYTNNPFAIGTIIQGLIAVGENPFDAKWKKNGKTMVEALLTQQIATGGFKFGDEFEEEYAFAELKSTEAAFGAIADLYTKTSMFNKSVQIIDKLPEINDQIKPFIEITELNLEHDRPLLSVEIKAFDNIDGELSPKVALNGKPVYSVDNRFKAIVQKGVNSLEVSTVNSLGNATAETIPVLFQNAEVKSVPQVAVHVKGLNGANLYTDTAILEDGDTAYSVLVKAIGKHNIISRPYDKGVYIVGINNLKELDYGPNSGWMYRINGSFPDVYAGQIELKDGDVLEWLYTKDLGKDVGYVPPANQNGESSGSGGGTINSDSQEIIDFETIQQMLKDDASQIMIKDKKGNKVEIPKASLQLQAGEKVFVDVNQHQDGKVIKATFNIVNKDGTMRPLMTGKGYVKITIPATNISKNTVVLQLMNGKYRAIPHVMKDGQIIIQTKTPGKFFVTEQMVTFSDLAKAFNQEEIEYLANRHVINGYEDGTFRPNHTITRAQFAAIISRTLGLQAHSKTMFADIKGQWYEEDVQALYEAGITSGKTATAFDPNAPITRQQAAAFMSRILEYVAFETSIKSAPYKDLSAISNQFKESIDLLYTLDIMVGSEHLFNPKGNLTREQAAKIIKRTLNVAELM